jgi:PilZ domain-containing protein
VALPLPQQVVRRSGRIPREIPILLIGTDLDGKVFSEPTKTVLLSLHGAGIVSRHKLSPELELVLRWPERNKEAEIRVVGQIGADSGRYTYGVAFSDSVQNFWEVEFPGVSAIERELGCFSLACSGCKTIERIGDDSIESDVCVTNSFVIRFCKHCGSSTIWKPVRSSSSELAQHQPPAPAHYPSPQSASAYSSAPSGDLIAGGLPGPARTAPTGSPRGPASIPYSASASSASPSGSILTLPAPAEKSASPQVNRRKFPRIRVNYHALVRYPGHGEDVVQCEDVSRGGLRFKSPHRYFEKALIEVAAPYSPNQPPIFVSAQIVFVQELPEQRLFRYGVAFVKSVRPRDSF